MDNGKSKGNERFRAKFKDALIEAWDMKGVAYIDVSDERLEVTYDDSKQITVDKIKADADLANKVLEDMMLPVRVMSWRLIAEEPGIITAISEFVWEDWDNE